MSRIFSTYDSTPSRVAHNMSSCAISIRTELSMIPIGGKSIPAVPKSTAESHDRKAILVFMLAFAYTIAASMRMVASALAVQVSTSTD